MGKLMYSEEQYTSLKNRLIGIYKRELPPEADKYIKVLERINSILLTEDRDIRPYDSAGLPGGMLYLKKDIPTIIVPDIHARMDFVINIMLGMDTDGEKRLQKIADNRLQVLCVGDGVHSEKRGASRWTMAYREFEGGYASHGNMDEEMSESFDTIEMIMEMKIAYPANFHFLKGNHENIRNEEGGGNYPFVKFSFEGPMTAYYVTKFYGEDFLEKYYRFEKNLPVFAVGKNFLVSHAEPWEFYEKDRLVEYRNDPDVIEGLTWTADDAAGDGSVKSMIDYYIEDEEDRAKGYYFGGHRPVNGNYNSRAGGRYIQIHNPNKFIIAQIGADDIDPDRDIIELENNIENIIKSES